MTDLNLIITPSHTTIGKETIHPETISIVLDNGHSYHIDTILHLLKKYDEKRNKSSVFLMRTKRYIAAYKQALAENHENP